MLRDVMAWRYARRRVAACRPGSAAGGMYQRRGMEAAKHGTPSTTGGRIGGGAQHSDMERRRRDMEAAKHGAPSTAGGRIGGTAQHSGMERRRRGMEAAKHGAPSTAGGVK